MDADLWLELVETQVDSGRWKFAAQDNRAKLAGCREALRDQIRRSLEAERAADAGAPK